MKLFTLLTLLLCGIAQSEVVVSPNMNLPVPVVNTTPGPAWANNINSCMSAIDMHDHTPGKGVPISSQAISINSSLPLNNNALTQVKDVAFTSQSSIATNQALYVEAPDLFYNDGNGNIIRITQSGSVAGASGTITGLPSGTASASYQSAGGTFQFQSSTSTPANGSFASLIIAPQTASPNGITIKSPNPLSASYNFTLPTAVPATNGILQMGTTGSLSVGPTAPTNPSPVTMNSSGTLSASAPSYFSGYFGGTSAWSTGSGSFVNGTNAGGNALTSRANSTLSVTAGASSVCGITWSPSSTTAVYLVTVSTAVQNTSSNQVDYLSLTDGSAVIAQGGAQGGTNAVYTPISVSGLYAPATTSAVTVKLQFAVSNGTLNTISNNSAADNVTWTVLQVAY